jgi:hypothetical protein
MVEYQYAIVPTGFTEDKWVQAVEVRPTERSVVHRIIAYVREPGSNYFKDQTPGVFFEAPPAKTDENVDTSALPSDFLAGCGKTRFEAAPYHETLLFPQQHLIRREYAWKRRAAVRRVQLCKP